jgi:hypothetical protein
MHLLNLNLTVIQHIQHLTRLPQLPNLTVRAPQLTMARVLVLRGLATSDLRLHRQ